MTDGTLVRPARRVHPRAVAMWTLSGALGTLVLAGLLAAANHWWWPRAEWGWWVTGAVLALGLLDALVVPHLRYRVHRWEVTPEAVVTREGWWSVEHRVAPLTRVQTVDLARGPLEQLFGLASVTVTTASHVGPVSVGPVALADAHALVEQLAAAAGTQDAT